MAGKGAGTKGVFLGEQDALADAVFPDLISAKTLIVKMLRLYSSLKKHSL